MSPAILSWSLTKIVLTVAATVFLFIVALEMYALAPVLPSGFSSNSALHQEASSRLSKETAPDGSLHLGLFGETMVAMLGSTDLPFTIFVPSKATFQKFFRIFPELSDEQAEKSSLVISADNNSDVYAALSRVFSFSAIPKPIFSHDLSEEQEIEAEALSGYKLYLSRVPGKGVLVNNLVCEFTDLRRGRVVMHVVNGVLLDPAFRRSMAFQNEALDDENRERDGGWSLQLMTFYLGAYEKKFVFLNVSHFSNPMAVYIYTCIYMHWNAISITILRFSTVEMGRCRDGTDSAEIWSHLCKQSGSGCRRDAGNEGFMIVCQLQSCENGQYNLAGDLQFWVGKGILIWDACLIWKLISLSFWWEELMICKL